MEENLSGHIGQIRDKLLSSQPGISPAKQKIMVILMPILFVILIFIVGRMFGTSGAKASAAKNVATTAGAFNALKDKIDWKAPKPYPAQLRDPMDPDSRLGGDDDHGNLVVSAILYSEDKPMAVVSEKVAGQGDVVLGATIVNINKDCVEFEMDGKGWIQKIRR